jgi:hypothetical protein
MFVLPTEAARPSSSSSFPGSGISGKTGSPTYTNGTHFDHRGAPYDALNPYLLEANQGCRMDYRKDMCAASLNILNRTAMFGLHPDRTEAEIDAMIERLRKAAAEVL